MKITDGIFSRKSDEWETPQDLFDRLNEEFDFTLDACADESNAKCMLYFDKAQDGLKRDWGGYRVWCNPPYSNVKEWIRKCYYEGHKPNTTVVALVFSRTDTRWWQNYVQHRAEVRFIKGRLRFNDSKSNAPFPSAIVIWRGPEE